jgi:hypothetical protein
VELWGALAGTTHMPEGRIQLGRTCRYHESGCCFGDTAGAIPRDTVIRSTEGHGIRV